MRSSHYEISQPPLIIYIILYVVKFLVYQTSQMGGDQAFVGYFFLSLPTQRTEEGGNLGLLDLLRRRRECQGRRTTAEAMSSWTYQCY